MRWLLLTLVVFFASVQIACAYDLTHTWTSTVTNHTALKVTPCSSPTGPCSGSASGPLALNATSWVQTVTMDGEYCSRVDYSRAAIVISSPIVCQTVNLMSGAVTSYTVTGP